MAEKLAGVVRFFPRRRERESFLIGDEKEVALLNFISTGEKVICVICRLKKRRDWGKRGIPPTN